MPPAEAGGKHAAMSAPLTYGIGAKAKNPDCAAFFLNWVATNEEARKINVAVGGSNPGGPADLPMPAGHARLGDRSDARGRHRRSPGQWRDGLHRQRHRRHLRRRAGRRSCRSMVGGQQTAAGLLKAVQEEYETAAVALSLPRA